jgi:Arc/MetJ-type ribon-helix-helix transcriptional regulator
MNVQLTKAELEHYVEDQVKAGNFPSAEAVVEDALERVIAERVALSPKDWKIIAESEAQIERGQYVRFEDFKARINKKYGLS